MGDLVKLLLAGTFNLDLDRLADAYRADTMEAQMLHGLTGGDTGWIENCGFGHDGDNGFHEAIENRARTLPRQAQKMQRIR